MTRLTLTPYSVRVEARHPDLKPWIFWLRDLAEDPWVRLAALRAHIPSAPNTTWPQTGWTLTMAYQCPYCREQTLITIEQSYKGQRIQCDVCGKDAPCVPAAGTPASSSPTSTPSSPVPDVERP